MSNFGSNHVVKATRKPSRCAQCNKMIEVDQPKNVWTGRFDGDFCSTDTHIECNEAAIAYSALHSLYGDEGPWFSDDGLQDIEDAKWMRDEHPLVFERLGWDRQLDEWLADEELDSQP